LDLEDCLVASFRLSDRLHGRPNGETLHLVSAAVLTRWLI